MVKNITLESRILIFDPIWLLFRSILSNTYFVLSTILMFLITYGYMLGKFIIFDVLIAFIMFILQYILYVIFFVIIGGIIVLIAGGNSVLNAYINKKRSKKRRRRRR